MGSNTSHLIPYPVYPGSPRLRYGSRWDPNAPRARMPESPRRSRMHGFAPEFEASEDCVDDGWPEEGGVERYSCRGDGGRYTHHVPKYRSGLRPMRERPNQSSSVPQPPPPAAFGWAAHENEDGLRVRGTVGEDDVDLKVGGKDGPRCVCCCHYSKTCEKCRGRSKDRSSRRRRRGRRRSGSDDEAWRSTSASSDEKWNKHSSELKKNWKELSRPLKSRVAKLEGDLERYFEAGRPKMGAFEPASHLRGGQGMMDFAGPTMDEGDAYDESHVYFGGGGPSRRPRPMRNGFLRRPMRRRPRLGGMAGMTSGMGPSMRDDADGMGIGEGGPHVEPMMGPGAMGGEAAMGFGGDMAGLAAQGGYDGGGYAMGMGRGGGIMGAMGGGPGEGTGTRVGGAGGAGAAMAGGGGGSAWDTGRAKAAKGPKSKRSSIASGRPAIHRATELDKKGGKSYLFWDGKAQEGRRGVVEPGGPVAAAQLRPEEREAVAEDEVGSGSGSRHNGSGSEREGGERRSGKP